MLLVRSPEALDDPQVRSSLHRGVVYPRQQSASGSGVVILLASIAYWEVGESSLRLCVRIVCQISESTQIRQADNLTCGRSVGWFPDQRKIGMFLLCTVPMVC
jgi:hypothetical protein